MQDSPTYHNTKKDIGCQGLASDVSQSKHCSRLIKQTVERLLEQENATSLAPVPLAWGADARGSYDIAFMQEIRLVEQS